MMNKLLIGLLGAGVIATGGYAAASGLDDTAPARTVSLPGATTDATTGTTTTDVATTDDIVGTAAATGVTATTGDDVSGPCDEAEHANDPRCTGGATDDDDSDDDRSGSNRGSDDDNNNDDDRSGSNSGSDHDDSDDNDD